MARVGRDPRDHPFPITVPWAGLPNTVRHWIVLPGVPSKAASRDGAATSSLGNRFYGESESRLIR